MTCEEPMTVAGALERIGCVAAISTPERAEWIMWHRYDAEALRIVLAMAKAAQGMAEALKSIEHPVTPEGGDMGLCASCGMSEIREHALSCKVDRALFEFQKASGGDAL